MRKYYVCWIFTDTGICGADVDFESDTFDEAQKYADKIMVDDDDYLCWVVSKPVKRK